MRGVQNGCNSANHATMKVTLTVTSRGVVTLPVEIYGERRAREFDAAEADLARILRRRKKSTR